jgi:hydroxymethylpyrimidine pyrophosphatase-like HAD family hydrolase
MTTSLIGLSDIDGTLIFCPQYCQGSDLKPACVKPCGEATMFLDSGQARVLDMLGQCDMLVPTTARNLHLFKQIKISFHPGYAILGYGGVILTPAGNFDQNYLDIILPQAKTAESELSRLLIWSCSQYGTREGFSSKLIGEADMLLYLKIKIDNDNKTDDLRHEFLSALAEQLLPGWQIRFNGKAILVCPPYLSKENAVMYFLNNIAPKDRVTIGFGDSTGDLPFMKLCDYIFMPKTSDLAIDLTA